MQRVTYLQMVVEQGDAGDFRASRSIQSLPPSVTAAHEAAAGHSLRHYHAPDPPLFMHQTCVRASVYSSSPANISGNEPDFRKKSHFSGGGAEGSRFSIIFVAICFRHFK